ncbi:MerR family transcriptional regulator [uncultured Clostridium sp.]|uniref:MerR family transcriptional regulator n=1 Tax=uncultured Clostridium sp. TaxID=59620 RepID=UPI0027298851|nr:MerR family transcriptional regulator [uncultured Clostridium sp.]
MSYTIKQVSDMMGISVSTLRYYDKEGLLPFIERKENGSRVFKDEDLKSLEIILCMKSSGAPIKDIKRYIDMCLEGDSTLKDRLEIFLNRREVVKEQMKELNKIMSVLEYKINYYEKAIQYGTEEIHKKKI